MFKLLGALVAVALVAGGAVWAQESKVDVSAPIAHATKHGKIPKPTRAIDWHTSLEKGMREAARTGRPLITYFTYDT